MQLYNSTIKRFIDLLSAIILFIALLPVFLLISLLVKIDSRGSVFYKALRGGYHNKPFMIYKFRTMIMNADKVGGGTTALNDARVTKVGKLLRKSKLDEIPQLLNIIKGDMSFVGPRPELPEYTSLYTVEEKRILSVRPGITDISSLKYVSLDEIVGAFNADEYYEKHVLPNKNLLRLTYVDEQSFALDIKLFFLTLWKVVRRIIRIFN
jgi:lipopolysaccharide/colanic/teichoic acid biosynthesis glycosyltransferase